jgi:L-seryl-tRNA(Ser) seleniumtransferase
MSPGEEKIVADRIWACLAHPPKQELESRKQPPAADLSGQWDVQIEYAAGRSNHSLYLRQQGNRIEGTHQGDFVSRDLAGSIEGDAVSMRSSYTEEHGDSLVFNFSGKVSGDEISGAVDMGEYLIAKWSAKRHAFRTR